MHNVLIVSVLLWKFPNSINRPHFKFPLPNIGFAQDIPKKDREDEMDFGHREV